MVRRFTGFILLATLVSASGCAYFNLFYNAKQAYGDAEEAGKDVDPRNQPTGAQQNNYKVAINKCKLLLEEYPDSDLVDDALVLMGKCQVNLKTASSYREGIRNFDNVLANFPESDLIEEVYYFKSVAHLALGEEQVALDYFRLLQDSYPDGRFSDEALARLGDTYADRGQTAEAIRYYREFLETNPGSDQQAQIVFSLGEILIAEDRLDEAEVTLAQGKPDKNRPELSFDTVFLRVHALKGLARYQEAYDLLNTVRSDATRIKRRGDFVIMEGQLQLALGNESRGIAVLEAAADPETKTREKPKIVEARYHLAEYFLSAYGPDDDRVVEQLELGMKAKAGDEFMTKLRDLREQMKDYDELTTALADDDSLGHHAAFALGELLYADLNRPADAAPYYQQVLARAPESALAPRAAYALGYLQAEYLDQPELAMATYDSLQANYPESVQARHLAGESFLEAKPRSFSVDATTGEIVMDQPTGGPFSGRPALDPRRSLRRGGPGASTPRERGS